MPVGKYKIAAFIAAFIETLLLENGRCTIATGRITNLCSSGPVFESWCRHHLPKHFKCITLFG